MLETARGTNMINTDNDSPARRRPSASSLDKSASVSEATGRVTVTPVFLIGKKLKVSHLDVVDLSVLTGFPASTLKTYVVHTATPPTFTFLLRSPQSAAGAFGINETKVKRRRFNVHPIGISHVSVRAF